MPRQYVLLIAILLAAVTGCSEGDPDPPQATAAVPAAPDAQAVATPGPAVPAPPIQPAPMPVVPVQPPPGSQQPLVGQQPPVGPAYANPNGQPGAATATVFVPYPPFVISPPPKTVGGLAGVNPALPPGQQQFAVGRPAGAGPGFTPPGVNGPPGSAANAERKPQTEIESYEGTELFAVAPSGSAGRNVRRR